MGDADLEGNVAFVGGTDSYSNDNDDSVVDEAEGKRGVKRKLEDNENEDAELTEEDIGKQWRPFARICREWQAIQIPIASHDPLFCYFSYLSCRTIPPIYLYIFPYYWQFIWFIVSNYSQIRKKKTEISRDTGKLIKVSFPLPNY